MPVRMSLALPLRKTLIAVCFLASCSPQDDVKPPSSGIATGEANDCGALALEKPLNDIMANAARGRYPSTGGGDYHWQAGFHVGVSLSSNGGTRSNSKAVPSEHEAACHSLTVAFGSSGYVDWQGDLSEPFFDGVSYLFLTPRLDFVLAPKDIQTLEQWRAMGEPAQGEATMVSSALSVRHTKPVGSGSQTWASDDIEAQNSPAVLECDRKPSVKFSTVTLPSIGNRDPNTCEFQSAENEYLCLNVQADEVIGTCDVSIDRLMVPDAYGQFYAIALSGELELNAEQGYNLALSNFKVVNPNPIAP